MTTTVNISETEARQHVALIRRLMDVATPPDRRMVYADALLGYGYRFVLTLIDATKVRPDLKAFVDEANELFLGWISGDRLTDGEEEDQRRARAALEFLPLAPGLARVVLRALQRLPAGHTLRDETTVVAVLESQLARFQREGDVGMAMNMVTGLLNSLPTDSPRARELVELSLTVSANEVHDAEHRRQATNNALGWQMQEWIRLRDSKQAGPDVRARFVDTARILLARMETLGLGKDDDARLVLAGALFDFDLRTAADTLRPLSDGAGSAWTTAADLEVKARRNLGDDARVITLLERLLPVQEASYLQAIADRDVASRGEQFMNNAASLGLAYARSGRWSDTFRIFERAKSPRHRHLVALRASASGRELLAAEARLSALRRGVVEVSTSRVKASDWLGTNVTEEARALEDYRARRPDLTSTLDPPTIAQAAAILEEGEGVVSLGVDLSGVVLVGIVRGCTNEPAWTEHRPDLTYANTFALFQSTEDAASGWMLELAARAPFQPKRSLVRMIGKVDAALGRSLKEFATAHRLTRLTISPHRLLHAIPFWALQSLAELDVHVVESLAQWMEWRLRVPTLLRKAIVVGNPTGDLDFARVEAVAVAAHLGQRGFAVMMKLGQDATEDNVRDAARGAGIFHFAGHAVARVLEPLLCSLLLQPTTRWTSEHDVLADLAELATDWSKLDNEFKRYAQTPLGRLTEEVDEFVPDTLVARQLDYSLFGTLHGEYFDGRRIRLAELWTTSDMLVDGSLDECGLAMICACESGRGDLRIHVDEGLGIPSCLEVGGVDATVCTLWPVLDVAALVFAHLFYLQLDSAAGAFNVRRAVQQCRRALSQLSTDQALDVLDKIRAEVPDAFTQGQLDLAERAILALPEPPFAHPYYWAAFTSHGVERLAIASRGLT